MKKQASPLREALSYSMPLSFSLSLYVTSYSNSTLLFYIHPTFHSPLPIATQVVFPQS